MEYIRTNGMIDIDDAIKKGLIKYSEKEVHGARTNKFWFNDYTWLYKDVDNDYGTYEEYAEVICYELAQVLNFHCAEYHLATHNGRKGVISKSVLNENEELIHGTQILTEIFEDYFILKMKLYKSYKELLEYYDISNYEGYLLLEEQEQQLFKKTLALLYNRSCTSIDDYIKDIDEITVENLFDYCDILEDAFPSNFIEMKNGIIMSNNLYDIWAAIEIYCKINGYTVDMPEFMSNLTDMFIFDLITNQGDRHADNWGIIRDKETKTIKLSPLYDNSGALALNREKAIINIDDFSKRLKVESKPGKRKGIMNQMKKTIEHTFSGVKIDQEDVEARRRNQELIDKYISESSYEFTDKLEYIISLINLDTLEKVFSEIERKTGVQVPEQVINVVTEVITFNINKIYERIELMKGGIKI